MNRQSRFTALPLLALAVLPGLLLTGRTPPRAALQEPATPTATATVVPTETSVPDTATSEPPTATPESGRPIVVVQSYDVSGGSPSPGKEFTLQFRLLNTGTGKARGVVASFTAGDFIPASNGGVVSAGALAAGASSGFRQALFAGSGLAHGSIGVVTLTVSYTDEAGTAYSESFNLGIAIGSQSSSPVTSARGTPTPTPTAVPRPLLIVVAHRSVPAPLRPGTEFVLHLEVHNFGGGRAERISMVLGGGSAPSEGDSGSNGSAAGGGEFTTFAPLGSSNIQFLGDLEAGQTFHPSQPMIVNGATKAGVYVMKITFNYSDGKGKEFSDGQVISLLVQSSPLLDISFYRPLEPVFIGQPAMLPIQVVNLDRTNLQLGRMQVSHAGATLENGEAMIGYLDPGGYFTLDPLLFPEEAGPITVTVSVGYVDDFHQVQSVTRELLIQVEPMPEFPEEFPPEGQGGPDGGGVAAEGGFWRILWRAVLGMLGLDSGPQDGSEGAPEDFTPALGVEAPQG